MHVLNRCYPRVWAEASAAQLTCDALHWAYELPTAHHSCGPANETSWCRQPGGTISPGCVVSTA